MMTSCLLISTVSKKFKRPSQVIRFSCQPRGMLRASQKKERLLTKEDARFDSINPNSFKSTHPARGVPNTIDCVPFYSAYPMSISRRRRRHGFCRVESIKEARKVECPASPFIWPNTTARWPHDPHAHAISLPNGYTYQTKTLGPVKENRI